MELNYTIGMVPRFSWMNAYDDDQHIYMCVPSLKKAATQVIATQVKQKQLN